MDVLQEKLDSLTEKYSVESKPVLTDRNTVIINDNEFPLLPHRFERRFIELKKTAQDGTLVGISVMRVARIVEKGSDIFRELYRELDLCRFILGKEITAVTAMQNGDVINVIATAEEGIVCTVEISATLAEGESPKDKHEIISQRGIACDIVVDAQLKQDSIYVFGENNKKFTDTDFELYGLSADQVAIVRSAFALARNNDLGKEFKAADKVLNTLTDKVKMSVKSGERQVI